MNTFNHLLERLALAILLIGGVGLIEDAAIARLCAIHHGRISYPTAKTEEVAESA